MFKRSQARLLGVHEHDYADSVSTWANEGPGTHVVLADQLLLPGGEALQLQTSQNGRYH